VHITAQGPRLRNDLYCVEWDVKLYYTIPYSTQVGMWHQRPWQRYLFYRVLFWLTPISGPVFMFVVVVILCFLCSRAVVLWLWVALANGVIDSG